MGITFLVGVICPPHIQIGLMYVPKLSGDKSPLHFGNFVTTRAAKSIISLKCVFNLAYGLSGVFKIKILYLDLSMDAGSTQRYAKVRPSLAKKNTCRAPSDTYLK